tara:strand:+ start:910 stop:1107 length:198 start_codon:yes stop_codon:yes gene_type:complete
MKKVKRKIAKKEDGSWDTSDLYRNTSKHPFDIEWLKYFNPMEGKDQILFIYCDRKTKRTVKYRFL